MAAKRWIAAASVALGVAACSINSGPKTGGTAAGTANDRSDANRIAGLDDEDRRRAHAARLQALETGPSGVPVAWRNPNSGRYGSVVPGPPYQAKGVTCRQYAETIYIEGNPQTARGTACREADGTWATAD